MKKKYYISLFVLFLGGFCIGQSIFNNPITGPNPSLANPFIAGQIVDPDIAATGIGRGAGIIANTGLNRYNARDWHTATFDNTAYFEFTITPNVGFEIDFASFVYTGEASPAGPTNILFRSSLDGYVGNIGVPLINGATIDLSTAAYQNITTPITFRVYAWGASAATGTFSINDFTFNGVMAPGCTVTTTWNGAWAPAVPDNTYAVIIDANYNSTINGGSFDACSLTVNAGNTLSIQGTDYVQVINDVIIDGTVFVATDASFVQVNDLSTMTLNGVGIGTMEKTTTLLQAIYSYSYWSSPVVNETIGEAGSGLDLVPVTRIFEYDATNFEDIAPADGFDDNSNDWSVASGLMIPGKGYAAFAQSSFMPFPQTQTYNFDGEFNNGVITIPVNVSPAGADPNWNLLGNPYPSGISANDFILGNPDLDGTIYLWTHNSAPIGGNPGPNNLNFSVDDYASYNTLGGTAALSGGTAPLGIIASGQGFFVEAINAGTATFNNAMRVTAGNDDFFRTKDRIWLNLENDYGAFSQILVGFNEDATNGIDRLYDGRRLDGGSYISFFSLIENEDERYAIQGREPLTNEENIPLGIKNLVEGDNEYIISIDNVQGLLEISEIFLVDKLIDFTHDLNSGEYRFSSEQGVYKDRFELLLKNNIPNNLVAVELIITKNQDDSITFRTSHNTTIQNIQIFDVLGRRLFNQDFNEEVAPNSIELNQLSQTIFIAKATLANGNVLTKKGLK